MLLRDYANNVPLPGVADDDELTLTRDALPVPVREYQSPGVAISVGQHVYAPDFAVRVLNIFGTKPALRGLGLLLLGQSFCAARDRVALRLSSPAKLTGNMNGTHHLDLLLLDPAHELTCDARTQVSLHAHCYSPTQPTKHPWLFHGLPPDLYDLPAVNVVDAEGKDAFDRAHEVSALGFGSLEGTLRMADFLLDISQADSPLSEFALEAEPGFRGVAPASCEMNFWLPGSLPFG